ncbi:MAG: hypothetical protein UHN02_03585 [Acutalibacteraceae bacterium]|nr:hypothetical protein [Acutalibacteraceae bacterium]
MKVEILVALISLAGTIVGTVSGVIINSKLINYRIEQLEKKVDKHNNLIERVYIIEQHNAVIDETLKVANHRINDLEEIERQVRYEN